MYAIALINPPDTVASDDAEEHAPPPIGLCSIAAYLREHGFTVDLYDLAEWNRDEPLPEPLLERLSGYRLVGLTSYTKTFGAAIDLVRKMRIVQPEIHFVFGGPHVTPCAAEVMAEFPEVHFVVKNDGEIPMLMLAEELSSGRGQFDRIPSLCWRDPAVGGALIENTGEYLKPPLDTLPMPARDFVIEPARFAMETRGRRRPGQVAFLTSTRGCPKRCTFCSIIVMSPKWRFRSAGNVLDEVLALRELQPVEHIAFMDANFFVDFRRADAISDALWELDPEITFSGTATADHVVKHEASVIAIAKNCAFLEIGIESGSDTVLERFGKRTTVAQNSAAIEILRRNGIHLDLDFIMYDPWTTLTELRENLAFLRRSELLGYTPADCLLNTLKIYPGTPTHTRAIEEFHLEASHSMELVPPFVHGETGHVYQQMALYRSGLNQEVGEAIESLTAAADACTGERRGPAQRMREVQVQLQHAPYEIFEGLLEAVGAGLRPRLAELPAAVRAAELVTEAQHLTEEHCLV